MQGFKLSLLLKLENIKATDRKTSLLQFCIQQAADQVEGILELPETMAPVKRAARLQVTAVDTLLAELRTGISEAKQQVVAACASDVHQQQAGDAQVRSRQRHPLRAVLSCGKPSSLCKHPERRGDVSPPPALRIFAAALQSRGSRIGGKAQRG